MKKIIVHVTSRQLRAWQSCWPLLSISTNTVWKNKFTARERRALAAFGITPASVAILAANFYQEEFWFEPMVPSPQAFPSE